MLHIRDPLLSLSEVTEFEKYRDQECILYCDNGLTGMQSLTSKHGLSPKDWIRRCFSACRYDVLPYAGLKLVDCVVSERKRNPKRVYRTVAFGEGAGEALDIHVKSCNRPWPSHPARLGNRRRRGLSRLRVFIGFQFCSAGSAVPPTVLIFAASAVSKSYSAPWHLMRHGKLLGGTFSLRFALDPKHSMFVTSSRSRHRAAQMLFGCQVYGCPGHQG